MKFIKLRTVLILCSLGTSIGCDFQSKIEVNDNILWQYMEKGEEYNLAQYLEERPSLVNEINEAGNSLLYEAITGSNIKIVEIILANGAKINFKNQFGRTPLHRAADEDRLDMVRLLLDQEACRVCVCYGMCMCTYLYVYVYVYVYVHVYVYVYV